jgi:beta-lactamase class A
MVRVTPSSSSPDSATFNPPHLSGKVSERTALEAMIIHSDNTGTDMILKHVGADRVRDFLAEAASNELISRTAPVISGLSGGSSGLEDHHPAARICQGAGCTSHSY